MMKTDLVVVANPSRECYSCGSTTTHIKRTGTGKPYPGWYGNGIDDQWLCERCENHLVKGPRYHPLTNPRRNKKHHKSCNCNYDHIVKPSRSGVVDNHFERGEPIYLQNSWEVK
jgi:ribosomal protein L37AE/L43A